jgi:hypothetical protein
MRFLRSVAGYRRSKREGERKEAQRKHNEYEENYSEYTLRMITNRIPWKLCDYRNHGRGERALGQHRDGSVRLTRRSEEVRESKPCS